MGDPFYPHDSGSQYDLTRLGEPNLDAHRQRVVDAVLRAFTLPLSYGLTNAHVLITGARGFFGRYVVDALLELNKRTLSASPCTIHALDSELIQSPPPENWRNAPNLVTHRHNVLHDLGLPVFNRPLTHVWHLAGIASPYWYKRYPDETIAVAVDGTRNMLALAREHKARFMFTSSSEVYQTADVVPTPEQYVGAIPSQNDRSCYDVSKLLAETLCYVAATQPLPVHATVVRIFNSFGPGMSETDRRILPRIMSAAKGKRVLKIFKPPSGALPRRTYTPVANTLFGFLLAAVKGESVGRPDRRGVHGATGIYNVGLDSPEITVPELVHRLSRASGLDITYTLVPPPENYETEPMRRCPDNTRLRNLGFLPVMDLDEGLKVFADWAMATYEGLE